MNNFAFDVEMRTGVAYAGYSVTKPNVEIHSTALKIDDASALHFYACPLGQ